MKYFTKEWYNAMQRMNLHSLLKIDEMANDFSEEYFQKPYNFEKKKWLSYKINDTTFEDVYNRWVLEVENKIPFSILKNVANKRVLALGRTSKKVYDEIKKYCNNNKVIFERAIEDYNKRFDEQFKNEELEFCNITFHDSLITDIKKEDDNYLFDIDNTSSFCDVKRIVFKNAKIIEQEGEITNCWWLYDEIYKVDNEYEIHLLIANEELKYLTIKCDSIIIE